MRLIHSRPATYAFAIALPLFALALSLQIPTHASFQIPTHEDGPDSRKGRAIFRFDTFGDEQLWTTVLRMHEVIPTIDPVTALGVGLKVDVEALPREAIAALRAGSVDLTDPAITLGLLQTQCDRRRERPGG